MHKHTKRKIPKANPRQIFAIVALSIAVVAVALTIPARVEVVVGPAEVIQEKPQARKPQARLLIPEIKVDAVIRDMGLTSLGAMAVPGNRFDVGWFSLGTRPGETGSAVIGGHNRWDDAVAVFEDLDQLEKGDVLSVVDSKGISTSFVVREMRSYNAEDDATAVFKSANGAHLNVITCSGVWNPSTKSYSKRLVVFTDLIQAVPEIAMVANR